MFDNNKKLQPCQKTPNKLCFLVVAVVDLNVLLTVLKNFFFAFTQQYKGPENFISAISGHYHITRATKRLSPPLPAWQQLHLLIRKQITMIK